MSITVNEIYQLKEMEPLKLVAGASGLNNEIRGVGILDYEFSIQEEQLKINWPFRKYDFVVTSLLFAKDKPELLLSMVEALVSDHISALAVKNVVFKTLPDNVIDYANEHKLPIFLFGREDAYFEDIITLLKNKIKERSNFDYLEHQISLFVRDELEIKAQRELARKLLPNRGRTYCVYYFSLKDEYKNSIRDLHRLFRLNGHEDQRAFYYKGGCIYICDWIDEKLKSPGAILTKYQSQFQEVLSMPFDRYKVSMSELSDDANNLLNALKQCLCANRFLDLKKLEMIEFSDMGIYQILLPLYRSAWFKGYSEKIIAKILEFDRQTEGDLYMTAKIYVEQFGDINKVAEVLHIHKNTVRYRINKIRELLSMEEDSSFDLQLFVAILTDELAEKFTHDI